ncbi:hypothetical protein CBFG_03264 [Clostridiales bacterium 1_7_47FAA]|nr:hypothetical protein CBFG_03264 [Clostridiales bacterium 1_7_47FAA]
MKKLFEQGIEGQDIINVFNRYRYVLTKTDVPYMPCDFPQSLPIGKDIDVLCSKNDFQ